MECAVGVFRVAFWPAGYGGSYFSPPWLWLLALNFDHAAMREPGNSLARDEAAWARLYDKTLDIVNKRLIERGLPTIEAASAAVHAPSELAVRDGL